MISVGEHIMALARTMRVIELDNGAMLTIVRDVLPLEQADHVFRHAKTDMPWVKGRYSRHMETPRLLWAMRDEGVDITKTYTITGSSVYSPQIKEVQEQLTKRFGVASNYAQMNYYRNGEDSIDWHFDREVMPGDSIMALSLGAPRKIEFRAKGSSTVTQLIDLTHNSLLIMNREASTQFYEHRIAKTKKGLREFVGSRISITFRTA